MNSSSNPRSDHRRRRERRDRSRRDDPRPRAARRRSRSPRRSRSRRRRSRSPSREHRKRRRRDRSGRDSRRDERRGRDERRSGGDDRVDNRDGESASPACIVSDSDSDDRKPSRSGRGRGEKYGDKWCGGLWNGKLGSGFDDRSPSGSSSSSPYSDRRGKRRRRSRGRRRKRSDRRSRSRSRSSRSRRRERSSGRKRRRSEKKRGSPSDDRSFTPDDSAGHFRGGPGTLIGDRYRIVRDVGLGTFGRVVECSRAGSDERVAIKIVRNVRKYFDSALIEGDICERVNREQSRQNKQLCAKMLDRFALASGHYCMVFERLGRSLYDFLKGHGYRPFPLFCVRDFSRQLLEALDFLHGFGLIHTDLKPENILLCHDDRSSSKGVPSCTQVKVIDFGGATFDNEKKSSIVNTRQYRAPEVILGWGWSYPSDLWSAGCIMAELYTGHLLFQTHDNAEHLALIEHTAGKFRKDLLDRSTSPLARECFDSRGWHRLKGVLSSRSAEHVRKMKPIERFVSEQDRSTGFGDLLRSLLTIGPNERATPRQALGSRFFA